MPTGSPLTSVNSLDRANTYSLDASRESLNTIVNVSDAALDNTLKSVPSVSTCVTVGAVAEVNEPLSLSR